MKKENQDSYTMNRRIAFGFIVATVLIALGFAISFYSYTRYGGDMQRIRHTYEVISALENTLSLMKDIETGSRGYVITGDPAYLEPYTKAKILLPGQLEQLAILTIDNQLQVKRRQLLEQLVKDKLVITDERLEVTLFDSRTNRISAESKRRMDRLRKHVALMIDTEKVLMETRNRQAERSFHSTLVIIFALSMTSTANCRPASGV
jgi:CHASE3 domain sensor protein